jgi:hypothetical protein
MKAKSIVKLRSRVLPLAVLCLLLGPMILPATPSQSSSLSGNLAIGKPARMSSQYSGEFPAASGVDGKVDTMFHTDSERNPWWQVDLLQSYSLGHIMLRNRRGGFQERTRSVQVLLSPDGNSWQTLYSHNGTSFKDLRVDAGGRSARFVRIQLAQQDYLHLSEIEVYPNPN